MTFRIKDGIKINSALVLDANGKLTTGFATPRTIAVSGDVAGSAQFDGTSNISISATATAALDTKYGKTHSGSDFVDGTLVTTSIDASGWAGDSFILECTGKSYSTNPPFSFIVQGYLYNDTIINQSGIHNGYAGFSELKILNYNGYLAFWWPRVSYWNSFQVHVRNADGSPTNRVTSIINSAEPISTKKVTVSMVTSWNNANDGSGSGLDADLLDGNHASAFATAGHTHYGTYVERDEFKSFGTITVRPVLADEATCTTAQFISWLESQGFFNYAHASAKCVWSYAANNDISDTGFGNLELAGSVIETWTDNSSDTVRGNITVRITRPTTGSGGGQVLVYNDQGAEYAPGWRQEWNSSTDGSGSGLDADLLDGKHASEFAAALHTHSYLTSESDTLATVTARGATTSTSLTLSSASNHYNGHLYYDPYDAAGNHYPHFNDGSNNNGTKINWRLFTGGTNSVTHTWLVDYTQFNNQMRATSYYDSNDTSYYLDPAGSGVRSGHLNGNLWINPKSESYGEGIAFNMPNQSVWGGVRWVRANAGPGSWALGYFGNEANDDIGFHNGTNGWRLDHSFNMTSTGSVRSPIFYDSNDTSYLVDPNGTSVLNELKINKLLDGSSYTKATTYDWNWRGRRYGGYVGDVRLKIAQYFWDTTDAPIDEKYVHTNSLNANTYFGENIWGDVHNYRAIVETYIYVHREFTISSVTLNGDDPFALYINGQYIAGGDVANAGPMYSHTFKVGWHHIEMIYSEGGGGHYVSLGWNPKDYTAYISAMTPFGSLATRIHANSASGLNNGTWNVSKSTIGGLHFTNGAGPTVNQGRQAAITFMGELAREAQAGIYVHNNNTYGTAMAFATTDSYATGPQIGFQIEASGFAYFPRSYVQAAGSFRAPVFYDSSDTGYYTDPNSTSDLAQRIRGGTLHGPNLTWGAYLMVGGDGRQNYLDSATTASVATTNGNLHLDSASGYTTHINWYDGVDLKVGAGDGNSIRMQVYGSSNYTYMSGSARSPIFYDSDDTGFYVDPNATTRLNALVVGWGQPASTITMYDSDEGSRSVHNNGGTIGFLGSAGNWRLRVADDGNVMMGTYQDWLTNQIRSAIFYDHNDTGYYVDPNSTSNMYRVQVADRVSVGSTSTYMTRNATTGSLEFYV